MSISTNKLFAESTLNAMAQVLPFGGLNRVDRFFKLNETIPDVFKQQIALLNRIRNSEHDEFDELVSHVFIEKDLKGAYCGELALLALKALNEIPECHAEYAELDDHAFVVIGRTGGDRECFETWNPDAYICDPWAEQCYPISEFRVKQCGPNIPYIFKDRIVEDHYLRGNPKIVTI